MATVTLKELLEAGSHFGHRTTRWNPKMRPYIFGARNGVYIIDLQKTLRLFKEALEVIKEIAAKGGNVLFVGTKPQAQEIVIEEASKVGMPHVTVRWLGGTLTNFSTIKNAIARLIELEGMKTDGTFDLLAKKEAVRREKHRLRLDKFLGGIKMLEGLPQAMFVIDASHEHIAVREAIKLNIPIIAMVDTNCNPDGITHLLPGNDDALRSIRLFVSRVSEAIAEGAALRKDGAGGKADAQIAGGDNVAQEILAAAKEDETKDTEKKPEGQTAGAGENKSPLIQPAAMTFVL